jgi:hypothetical protein
MKYIVRLKDDNRTANVFYNKRGDELPPYEVVYLENKINKGLKFFNTEYEAVQSAMHYTSEGVMK